MLVSFNSSVVPMLAFRLRAIVGEPVKELLTIELERLHHAHLAIWPRVRKGDIQAIEAFLKIQDRRVKLNGIEPPQRRELSVRAAA